MQMAFFNSAVRWASYSVAKSWKNVSVLHVFPLGIPWFPSQDTAQTVSVGADGSSIWIACEPPLSLIKWAALQY